MLPSRLRPRRLVAPARPRRFAWLRLRFPLLVCAGLGLAELALRLPAAAALAPAPTIYYDKAVSKRLAALDRVLQAQGRVDVLFIGSSVVRTNVSPLEFDRAIAHVSGLDLISFNGGLSGLWPAGVELYLRDLWLERVRPRLVVQAIRYTELRATEFSVDKHLLEGIAESHWHGGSMLDRLEWHAIEHVRLLQMRGAMGAWLRSYENGRQGRDNESARWDIDSRGYTARTPSLEVLLARGLLGGEQPYSGTCSPGTCGFGIEALRRTYEACRGAGAAYVLVNMPEHAFRWSARDGHATYATYLSTLEDFARRTGFEFVDLSSGNPTLFHDNQEFADFHHMTPAGARRLTRLLAENLGQTRALLDLRTSRLARGQRRATEDGGAEAGEQPEMQPPLRWRDRTPRQ